MHCLLYGIIGDGCMKIWDMNSHKRLALQWRAHDSNTNTVTTEILSADWCKYNQVCVCVYTHIATMNSCVELNPNSALDIPNVNNIA